jgi:hypothetical protein
MGRTRARHSSAAAILGEMMVSSFFIPFPSTVRYPLRRKRIARGAGKTVHGKCWPAKTAQGIAHSAIGCTEVCNEWVLVRCALLVIHYRIMPLVFLNQPIEPITLSEPVELSYILRTPNSLLRTGSRHLHITTTPPVSASAGRCGRPSREDRTMQQGWRQGPSRP